MSYIKNKTNKNRKNRNVDFKQIINNLDDMDNQDKKIVLNDNPVTNDDWNAFQNKHNDEFKANNFIFPKQNTNYDPNDGSFDTNEERNSKINKLKKPELSKINPMPLFSLLNKNTPNKQTNHFGINVPCMCVDCTLGRIDSSLERKTFGFPILPPPIFNEFTNSCQFRAQPNSIEIESTKPYKKMVIEMENKLIDVEINTLDDLIKMINDNPSAENVKYNIDMETMYKIKPNLIELNNMIGMKELKNNVIDQIIYFSQNFHKVNDKNDGDFMHTVIYGPPGTGKTEVAKILGKIFSNLGVLQKGTFKKATRSDLIAGYLGQTAIKTKDLINSCIGGVLFIDEAYALGNDEKKDSFSKECIDTLCEALSDHKHEIMVIIAGYEKELYECFFSYNQGLNSRFTWRFKTDDYGAEDLMNIFIKKINDHGWSVHPLSDINVKWFEENLKYFKFYGRDMETLFTKTKIAHSRRVFCKPPEEKTKINKADLDQGLKMFLNNDEVKHRKNEKEMCKDIKYSMYN